MTKLQKALVPFVDLAKQEVDLSEGDIRLVDALNRQTQARATKITYNKGCICIHLKPNKYLVIKAE